MSFQVIVTLIMLLVIIVLIFKAPTSPGVIFTGVPIISALIMGYSLAEINSFIGDGLKSVSGTLFLMVFAVLYFGILTESGVFNALIQFIMKILGNSVIGTMMVTAVLSMASQLSGSGATCALCTLPTMQPVFEKQKIRPTAMLLVMSISSGVLCLVPWAPGINEAAAYAGIEVYDMFVFLRPLLVFSIIAIFGLCVIVSIVEKRHGAGMTQEEFQQMKNEISQPLDLPFGTKKAALNGVATVILLAALLAGWIKTNIGFGIGFVLLLLVNYRGIKEQSGYMKRQSPVALNMAFTMLGVGVLVGINSGTGALNELASVIAASDTSGVLAHLPFIMCLLSLPLSITIGGTKNSVVMPAIIPIVASFGFTPVQVMSAVFATGVISANVNLFNASPYLALSLAGGVEMRDHLKYSLLPIYGFSLLMTAFMVVTGMLPI